MQQPPAYPPQTPPRNGLVKPLLIGCGVVFVVLLAAGGLATWFTMRAVGTALHNAGAASQVAQGVVSGAEQAAAQAGASPDPEHAAAAGAAVLKSFVGGGKPHVETLSRDELKADLPDAIGALPRTSAESQRSSFSGISGTTATATYGGNDGTVTVAVTDAANMAGLTTIMDIAMGIESEDDNGYEKSVQLGDVKVHEKWENAAKHAELIGIVAGRFVVDVTGNGVPIAVDEQAFQAVNVAKLASVATAK